MNEIIIDKLPTLISEVIKAENNDQLHEVLADLSTLLFNEQYALLIEAVPHEKRLVVWSNLTQELQRTVFVQIKKESRTELIHILPDEQCFELLAQLDFDAVLEIAEVLPDRFLNYAIKHLDESQKALYQQAQQYEQTQLGYWVDHNYVRISEKLKTTSAKRLIQKGLNNYTEDFYTVNKQGALTGTVSINKLMLVNDESILSEITETDTLHLHAQSDLVLAAETLILSGKMSLPVVDNNGLFIGRFTIGLAYQAKTEKSAKELTSAGGLNKDEDLFASVKQSAKNRSVWLGINLITAFLASGVIGLFDITLQQVVLLAVLMPVVASMGGISGSQTLTLIVRGLALGQITQANLSALLIKELKVGLTNGIIWSLIIGIITYLWFNDLGISIVLGIAILGNLITAAASGVIIPSLLNKWKIDPALSGAVLLTTMTDVVGFFIFLGLGSLFLI